MKECEYDDKIVSGETIQDLISQLESKGASFGFIRKIAKRFDYDYVPDTYQPEKKREFVYEGKYFLYSDLYDLFYQLRHRFNLSCEKVGQATGYSDSYVWLVLSEDGNIGNIEYPELKKPALFLKWTDNEIAEELGVTLFKVETARKKLDVAKIKVIDLFRRRMFLIKSLTGKAYKPGPNFTDFLKSQNELLEDFYIKGSTESNDANSRKYRFDARNELKLLLTELADRQDLAEFLCEKGVINE